MHSNTGNYDLALPLDREGLEISRRVLGPQHPQTLEGQGNLGIMLINMGDDAAAAPLLREAVQGLTEVYSAEHSQVRHFQGELDRLTERQTANAAAEQPSWRKPAFLSWLTGKQVVHAAAAAVMAALAWCLCEWWKNLKQSELESE